MVERAAEGGFRNRQAARLKQQRQPTIEEVVRHQGGAETQPQQRRDPCQPALENAARVGGAGHRCRYHELGVVGDRQFRPHLARDANEFGPPVWLQGEEFDRFGEREQQAHGDRQRHDAADQKQHGPAIVWNQPRRYRTRSPAAEGDSGKHEYDERRAPTLRRQFRIQRDRVGHQAAEADSGDHAQDEHLCEVGRADHRQGTDAVEETAGNDRDAAAVAIADPAHQRRAEQNPEQAGAEHRSQGCGGHAPMLDELRSGEGHRGNVVAVGEHRQERPHEQADVESPDVLLIDQLFDTDDLAQRTLSWADRSGTG